LAAKAGVDLGNIDVKIVEDPERTFRVPHENSMPSVLEAAHGVVFKECTLIHLIQKLTSCAIDKWSSKGPNSAIGPAMKRA
jgi:hypothetical protein